MKSNNSTLVGMFLLVLLWLTYQFLTAPTEEQIALQKQKQEAQIAEQLRLDSIEHARDSIEALQLLRIQQDTQLTEEQRTQQLTQLQEAKLSGPFGLFSNAAAGESQRLVVENDLLRITFDTKGGQIREVWLKEFKQYNHDTEDPYDKEDLLLMNNPRNEFAYIIPIAATDRGDISTADLFFEPELQGKTLNLRAYSNDRQGYIQQTYTLNDNYLLDYQLTLQGINTKMPRGKNIQLKWISFLEKIEKNPDYEATMTTVYYKEKNDNFNYCDCRSNDKEQLQNSMAWVSHSQQFFNSSLFSRGTTNFSGAVLETIVADGDSPILKKLGTYLEFETLDQPTATYDMQWYIGPNDYDQLVMVGDEFERIIPFGWSIFGFISRSVIRPLFNFFALFISNYGIIILMLTFLIRLVLFPLQYKMLKNGVKMSVMKPELDAMRKKHKDDPAGMQAAQMSMYQDYGLNPLGGCLPMVLTMPIWIALYRFFPSSIAFRQESFLWADDLVSYDSIWDFGYVPFIHNIYGDHVSLFTLLWMLSMFGFLWYNSKQMDMTAAAGGGANMKMMKYMQYSFPVLFFFALNSWAAGLTAYMLFSNLLNIAQTFLVKNVLIDKTKLREELLANKERNKNNPKAKTGFMAKYQELLKEQQEMERRKKNGGK